MDMKITGTAIAVILGFSAIVLSIFLSKETIGVFGNRVILFILGAVFTWLGIRFSS